MYILTSPDDPEYQRAFTALDELKLAFLKPFFKEHFLQVTATPSNFSLFTSVVSSNGPRPSHRSESGLPSVILTVIRRLR